MLRNGMRATAVAIAAAVALATVSLTPAHAGRRGDAAAVAAVVGLFGTVAAIAAANAARDRAYDYYDGPVYAAPPQAYAPRYRGQGWHRGHHLHGRHWHR
jgi:hypothetical protein